MSFQQSDKLLTEQEKIDFAKEYLAEYVRLKQKFTAEEAA